MHRTLLIALVLACGAAPRVLAQGMDGPPPRPSTATAAETPLQAELRRDLEDVDIQISWIDYILRRAEAGDVIVSMDDSDVFAKYVPLNRADLIDVIQRAVADGEITAQEGSAFLIAWTRTSARKIAGLRTERAELVQRREQLQARLAKPTQLRPWELGRPPAEVSDGGDGLVGDHFAEVCAAIPVESCARMYADLSVVLARYGAGVGWVNGMDPNAPAGDPGRGVTAWQPHFNHGVGPGAGRLGGLISRRLDDLHLELDPATEARMEGEANGVINGYTRKY